MPRITLSKAQLAARRFASTEAARPNLNGVHLFPDGSVEASNGHIAVRVTPHELCGDTDRYPTPSPDWTPPAIPDDTIIPVQACADAEKAIPKKTAYGMEFLKCVLVESVNGKITLSATNLDTTARIEATPTNGPFPHMEQVFPKENSEFAIGFNLRVLKQVIDGLIAMDGADFAEAKLEFYGPLKACRITRQLETGERAVALAMPVRIKDAA